MTCSEGTTSVRASAIDVGWFGIGGGKIAVDGFAGWGGASLGIEQATRRAVAVCMNHCPIALKYHAINHPFTRHIQSNIWDVDPAEAIGSQVRVHRVQVRRRGRRPTVRRVRRCVGRAVGLAWFSPDCRHFSGARGAAPVSPRVRSLAWVVIKWAKGPKPDRIMVENVREFLDWGPTRPKLDRRGRQINDTMGRPAFEPIPERKGETFKRWVRALKAEGYEVDWRVLDAADYGVPQHRRRLIIIARRDGRPIVWPRKTHGPVDTRAQTTGKTGRRRPVVCDHHRHAQRPTSPGVQGLDAPRREAQAGQVHASNDCGRIPYRTAAECLDFDHPIKSIFDRTIPHADNTQERLFKGFLRYVADDADPFVLRIGQTGGNGANVRSIHRPLSAITTKAEHCLVLSDLARLVPHVVHVNHGGKGLRGHSLKSPTHAVTGSHGQAVSMPLVVPWLAKHYRGVVGHRLDRPLGTITNIDHHSYCLAHLTQFRGTNKGKGDLRSPAPAITAGGTHLGLTLAFLMKFYSSGGQWQRLNEPLHTVTVRERFAIVQVLVQTADGLQLTDAAAVRTRAFGWCIVLDIFMRMLTPRELARCQGFPDDYILPKVKRQAVKLIGNSVCPPLVEALVRANCGEECAA